MRPSKWQVLDSYRQPLGLEVVYNRAMPDPPARGQTPPESPVPPGSGVACPSEPVTDFRIGEEFGTAKRNLPPARIVLVCLIAVAIVIAIFAFKGRPKPQGWGSIDFVTAVDVPGQKMILVAITFTLRNSTDKPLWIHTLNAQLATADGRNLEDDAASAVDLDRYFQGFPRLKESSERPLSPETKLPAGTTQRGTIVVSFPIAKEDFDQRKSLTVTIQPYDQPLPIILK